MSTVPFANGTQFHPMLPNYGIGAGLQTPFGTLLPPAIRCLYVRSTGGQDGDTEDIKRRLHSTLAAALRSARSGMGDTIVCLPGHSESVADATMLDNLVDGTNIIGVGWGGNRPVFRWTTTASQWVLDNADVRISGLRLRLEGAVVVKAIVCTAADNAITNCDIEMGSGAANLATIGIEAGTGAARFTLANNLIRGTANVSADPVKIVGVIAGAAVTGNRIYCAGTSATGIIHVTAAATSLDISNNRLDNLTAASIAAIGVDSVAASGSISGNFINVLATGAHVSATSGIALGANSLVRCFQNFSCNDPNVSGLLMPSVDT